jgi:hypothetical protein
MHNLEYIVSTAYFTRVNFKIHSISFVKRLNGRAPFDKCGKWNVCHALGRGGTLNVEEDNG